MIVTGYSTISAAQSRQTHLYWKSEKFLSFDKNSSLSYFT